MPTSNRAWRTGACSVLAAVLLSGSDAASTSPDAAEQAMATIRPEAIRADMRFLSDDLLEGRGTATRGHEVAAKFMATQFEGLGLQPVGDGGTYSSMPRRSSRASFSCAGISSPKRRSARP